MRYSLIIAFLFSSLVSFSQGEANNWYFGEYAGITFNTKPVSALTNGKLNSVISNSTISTKKGRLLFYTDGYNVWDSMHNITPNGTLSSIKYYYRPSVIIPKPGSSKQYYIFTVDDGSITRELQYSIFDMSLNSGKGDIVSTKKIIKVADASGGRIAAVQHSNGKDFWVISLAIDTMINMAHDPHRIEAWLVTESGISNNPVKSKIGQQFNYGGFLKISPDGTKITTTSSTPTLDSFVIADFDANSGNVTNVWKLNPGIWGMEFSATSNHLYVSANHQKIYQFNPKVKSKADFINSKILVDSTSSSGGYGAMQLGPDRKIYLSNGGERYLPAIHAPDSADKLCRFQLKAVSLSGKRSILGLPAFIQSFFNPELSFKGTCFGDTAWFAIEDLSEADSVHWTFGDTISKAKNIAKGYNVFHLFSDTGTYTVRSISFKKNLRDTVYLSVKQRIYLGRFMELKKEIYKCFDDTIEIGVGKANEKRIKWSTGSDIYTTQIVDSGYVWAKKYYGSQCYTDDTTRIIFYKNNILNERFSFGNDKLKCHYDTVGLGIIDPKATKYLWSTGSTQKSIKVPYPDTVWLKVYHGKSCYKVDTIGITNFPVSNFTLGPDTFVCGGQSILLGDFKEPQNEYLWFNKSTSSFYNTDVAGKFWLRIRDKNRCLKTDTITVSFLNPPKVNLGKDTAFCSNSTGFILDAKNISPFNKYIWGTNSIQQTDTAKKTGKYWVRVTNKCGTSIDSINLNFLTKPLVIFPDEIIFCDALAIELGAANTNDLKYYWNTKATTPSILIRDTGIYKVIVSNICGKDSASVHVIPCLKYIKIDVKKTCINKPVDFSIPSNLKLDSVKWNFGDTASTTNTSKISPKVSHIYKHFGNYKISLVLFYKGRKDTISASVSFINPKPDFTVSDVCENDSVRFKNKSLELHNLSFYWKFGDGQNSVLVSPAHLYQIHGVSQTFNVSLVGKNSDGCSDSITNSVTVNANPISDFSITANYNVVDFKASKTGNTQYKWIFGNGDSAITGNSNYKYTYPNIAANYKACLHVKDAAGCFSKTCKDVNISAGILPITKANGFKIYPNPNSGNFTIEIDKPSKDISIEVYNLLGEKVKVLGIVEKVSIVNLDMANGIYLIKVKNGGIIYYQKVSISK